jgi:hypothetical protein
MTSKPRLISFGFGNEDERFIGTSTSGSTNFDNYEGFLLNDSSLLPEGLEVFIKNQKHFLSNGWLIYPDNAIETGSPECVSPSQLHAHNMSMEYILNYMTSRYIEKGLSDVDELIIRRHHRSAVVQPSNKNPSVPGLVEVRKGCHDNFSVDKLSAHVHDNDARALMLGHAATMQLFAGAGFVGLNGPELSQKAGGVIKDTGCGRSGCLVGGDFKVTQEGRQEFRAIDANISPWAFQVRIAATALMLACLRIKKLRDEINKFNVFNSPVEQIKDISKIGFTAEGQIYSKYSGFNEAIAFQEHLAETYLTQLPKYSEVSDEYLFLAEELANYLQDLRAVFKAEKSLGVLADRSDFAAKFGVIIRHMLAKDKDPSKDFGLDEVQLDMKYDVVVSKGIKSSEGVEYSFKRGYGWFLAENGHFRIRTDEEQAQYGVLMPPVESRAYLRHELITDKTKTLQELDWGSASWTDTSAVETARIFDIDVCSLEELQDKHK